MTLQSLQNAGHIGAYGVSVASTEDAVEILRSDFPLDVIEFPFSLFDQSALLEVLPLARKRRVGVLAREPLANGFLSGSYAAGKEFTETDMRASLPAEYRDAMVSVADQLADVLARSNRTLAQAALRFVLDEIAVSGVAVGMRTTDQVEQNVLASEMTPLTEADREAIHTVFFPEDQ
jgi:aryl-alcohol dehydrogenase-like predicted oxidoreductase